MEKKAELYGQLQREYEARAAESIRVRAELERQRLANRQAGHLDLFAAPSPGDADTFAPRDLPTLPPVDIATIAGRVAPDPGAADPLPRPPTPGGGLVGHETGDTTNDAGHPATGATQAPVNDPAPVAPAVSSGDHLAAVVHDAPPPAVDRPEEEYFARERARFGARSVR